MLLAVVSRRQVVVVVVGGRTWGGVTVDLACSEGVVDMRPEEAVVLVRNEQTRCSGCKAASQLARVAIPGKAVVRIVGGIQGVVVVLRRPKPWASWS